MLVKGEVLEGRYRIEAVLGKGGMSSVYLAQDTRLPRQWAIKAVISESGLAEDMEAVQQSFGAEAEILSSLNHPNLPRIVDFFPSGAGRYLVMDYIEGFTLEEILENGALPLDQVLDMAKQLADVLIYLHEQRKPIIFRDLKPANIIVMPDGQVKLIDFGIARLFNPQNLTDTQALGTPGYAAPEQYGKSQSDPRTDIFALGATLHHSATGRNPADAPFVFPPLHQLCPDAPPVLAQVIDRCVALECDKRPQTAREVAAELAKVRLRLGRALQQRQQELIEARAQIGRLEQEVQTLWSENRGFREGFLLFHEDFEKKCQELEQLRQSNSSIQSAGLEMGKLEAQLRENTANLELASHAIKRAKLESQSKDVELAVLRTRLDELVKENERLQRQASTAQRQLIERDVDSLLARLASKDQRIEQLSKQLQMAQGQVDLLRLRLTDAVPETEAVAQAEQVAQPWRLMQEWLEMNPESVVTESCGCRDPELRSDIVEFLGLKGRELSQILGGPWRYIKLSSRRASMTVWPVAAGGTAMGFEDVGSHFEEGSDELPSPAPDLQNFFLRTLSVVPELVAMGIIRGKGVYATQEQWFATIKLVRDTLDVTRRYRLNMPLFKIESEQLGLMALDLGHVSAVCVVVGGSLVSLKSELVRALRSLTVIGETLYS